MSPRRVFPLALAAVVAVGGLAPAVAAPKPKPKPKPISEEYAVQGAPVPYPAQGTSCMEPALEGLSMTTKTIKPTGAGRLDVTLTGFSGDWDITVKNDKGVALATGGPTTTPTALTESGVTEKLTMKIKKGMTLDISVCNFLGGPSANAKYVFTYT